MLSIISFAIENYGWNLEQTLDSSIIFIMMLMRQKIALSGKGGISLLDQEKLDRIGSDKKTWEELVAENHRNLAKNFK